MSSHYSTLSTCCIKATVRSIRYLTGEKVGLLFYPINWQLTLFQAYYKAPTAFTLLLQSRFLSEVMPSSSIEAANKEV